MMQRLRWFIQDLDHPAGVTWDPAETDRWCAWVSFKIFEVFLYPWKIKVHWPGRK